MNLSLYEQWLANSPELNKTLPVWEQHLMTAYLSAGDDARKQLSYQFPNLFKPQCTCSMFKYFQPERSFIKEIVTGIGAESGYIDIVALKNGKVITFSKNEVHLYNVGGSILDSPEWKLSY